MPCAPDGIPIVNADGTIEVRVYSEAMVGVVKNYLKDSGFDVVREQIND